MFRSPNSIQGLPAKTKTNSDNLKLSIRFCS